MLHFVSNLKDAKMNVQCNLIWELKLYINWAIMLQKQPKNICCVKGEGAGDHSRVTRWFKKFCLGCRNLINQVRSGRPKTMCSNWRVSGELSISQSSIICHLHNLPNCVSRLPKYSKIFDSSKYIFVCFVLWHINLGGSFNADNVLK